jgi:hypothetical protein
LKGFFVFGWFKHGLNIDGRFVSYNSIVKFIKLLKKKTNPKIMAEEKWIERYKQLYQISKNHKLSRTEIAKLIAAEYHKIKKGLKDGFYLQFAEIEYNKLTNDSKKFISDHFPNEQLYKEFFYILHKQINLAPYFVNDILSKDTDKNAYLYNEIF